MTQGVETLSTFSYNRTLRLLAKWYELCLPTLLRADFKSVELSIDLDGNLFQTHIRTLRVPVSLGVLEHSQVEF